VNDDRATIIAKVREWINPKLQIEDVSNPDLSPNEQTKKAMIIRNRQILTIMMGVAIAMMGVAIAMMGVAIAMMGVLVVQMAAAMEVVQMAAAMGVRKVSNETDHTVTEGSFCKENIIIKYQIIIY
jgi:sterol desaturase/sphingolipid hydroxylase (fatty acid hydroxylase superfamily)